MPLPVPQMQRVMQPEPLAGVSAMPLMQRATLQGLSAEALVTPLPGL